MGRSRYKFIHPDQTYFITLTVVHWIPVFTRPATVEIIFDSLRYLMAENLKLYAFVVLENHLHMVVQSPDISKDISRLKSYTARELIRFFKRNKISTILDQLSFYKKTHKPDRVYQLWQEGVHPEWIQNEEMMRQKIDYIHQNPVKRGYIDDPLHWCNSSARNYAGLEGVDLDVTILW